MVAAGVLGGGEVAGGETLKGESEEFPSWGWDRSVSRLW